MRLNSVVCNTSTRDFLSFPLTDAPAAADASFLLLFRWQCTAVVVVVEEEEEEGNGMGCHAAVAVVTLHRRLIRRCALRPLLLVIN